LHTRRRSSRLLAALAIATVATFLAPGAPAQAAAPPYVALGDSYSSGPGIGDYTDRDCKRSDRAYPHLLAAELGAELDFAACSGATTDDLRSGQAGRLGAETDLVTVTVGGNDIEWSKAIKACITPFGGCMDHVERAEKRAVNELPDKLAAAYGEIAERAPEAAVYVLGYPRLFNAKDECDAFGQISIAEQERMNQAADVLSEIVEKAANAGGFTYVDVRDAFEGHAVCDSSPWINGLRHPVAESYHPNAEGHSDGYFAEAAAELDRSGPDALVQKSP
jgi:lysophospholipase L1-like esterase